MINQQVLDGNWNEVSGKLKAKWGKLTDDDVRTFNGNVQQLVGRIQEKTGETRANIERFLDQLTEDSAGVVSDFRDKIEETADQVAEGAREGYETLRHGYAEAERVVQQRPGQAMAVAFGLGLLSGLGLALLLRERAHESRFSQGRTAAEHFGRQVRDALADVLPDSLAKRVRG